MALSRFHLEHSEDQDRWITRGLDSTGKPLVVCHTFQEMGVPTSFAMAPIQRTDAKALRSFISRPLWSYAKHKMGLIPIPAIFTRYHNEPDPSISLHDALLQKMSELVYQVVTMLDKS